MATTTLPVSAPVFLYGGTAANYTPSGCVLNTTANPQLAVCTTVEGAGQELSWWITIAGQQNPSSPSTAYALPQVLAINTPTGGYATRGGETLIATGLNFGPPQGAVSRLFLLTFTSVTSATPTTVTLNCSVLACVANHTTITFQTVAGAGRAVLTLVVAGQSSVDQIVFSYARPSIASSTLQAGQVYSTRGGFALQIVGDNLGPIDAPWLQWLATFNPQDLITLQFYGTCVMVVSQTTLNCTVPAGIGEKLQLSITVYGLQSSRLSLSARFATPVVSGVSPGLIPAVSSQAITVLGNGACVHLRSLVSVLLQQRSQGSVRAISGLR